VTMSQGKSRQLVYSVDVESQPSLFLVYRESTHFRLALANGSEAVSL